MKASGQLSDAAVSIVASQQQGPGSKSRLGFVCLGGISIFLHRYKEEEKGKNASLAVGINVRLL